MGSITPGQPAPEFQDIDSWTPQRFLRRHSQRAQRRRRLRRFVLWSTAALLVWGFVFAEDGLISLGLRQWKIHRLHQDVARLEQHRDALLLEIQRRENDPATLEKLAREEYGMIFPGEKVVRIRSVPEAEARRVERRQLPAAEPAAADSDQP